MTEKTRPDATEDPIILEVLEALSRWPPHRPAAESPERATLRRLHTELLGLLAYAEEPIPPPPAARSGLLDRLRGEETVAVMGAAGGGGRGREGGAADAPASGRTLTGPGTTLTGPGTAQRGRAWLRWAFPLAAVLALCLLGLSAFLYQRLQGQERRLERLAGRLAGVEERDLARTAARSELEELRDQLALVSSPGVEICVLRPVAGSPAPPAARGVLYVAADHQHWYLAVEGLEPGPEGRGYRLWFVTDEGAVGAGSFEVGAAARVALGSETMPANTRAAQVTLEAPGPDEAARPGGTVVLYGDEMMRIPG